jgi:hypothetical protein
MTPPFSREKGDCRKCLFSPKEALVILVVGGLILALIWSV